MNKRSLKQLVRRALREDVGGQDLTTSLTVPADLRCTASLVAKGNGVLSGTEAFRMTLDEARARVTEWSCNEDGSSFGPGDCIARFDAQAGPLLTGERTALNFLQHLSGIATLTAKYVIALEGSQSNVCDTRKTTPGLRALEKKAVKDGGGLNHRFALYDGILIKENHILAAGGITEALRKAHADSHHLMKVEIEVTTPEEVTEAIEAGADVILLDNMSVEAMKSAVVLAKARNVITEASGNVTLETIRDVATTEVDLISVGAITHSAPAADVSLLIDSLEEA